MNTTQTAVAVLAALAAPWAVLGVLALRRAHHDTTPEALARVYRGEDSQVEEILSRLHAAPLPAAAPERAHRPAQTPSRVSADGGVLHEPDCPVRHGATSCTCA